MKIFFRRIHLYLAFAAGLVIMITCLTGAILVFEKELQHLLHADRYFTKSEGARMPLDQLVKNLKLQEPTAKVGGVKVYNNPKFNVEISFTKASTENKKITTPVVAAGKNDKKPPESARLVAFADPYSGKIVQVYNHRASFFYFTMDVHRWMLGGDTGKLIVGICTLLFLFILLTGMILWWPKTKNILKQRVKIKWDSGWKRLNHDFHIVLGFYSAIFLFMFAFTGLAWSFDWFNKGIYKITGSSQQQVKPPLSNPGKNRGPLQVEEVLNLMRATAPTVKFYNISLPKDSLAAYSVNVLPNNASHESAADTYFIDSHHPEIISIQKFGDRNLGQRVRSTFKPVHVASIFGLPSKIIGFIVCLLGVFFPASGYIMWWLRTSKRRT